MRGGIDHAASIMHVGIPSHPSASLLYPPTGTLQFACLIWAGAAQANRVRRLYLASLLSQVRMSVEGWCLDRVCQP